MTDTARAAGVSRGALVHPIVETSAASVTTPTVAGTLDLRLVSCMEFTP
jgi:hypothetical protein